jgi:hypothetical protein
MYFYLYWWECLHIYGLLKTLKIRHSLCRQRHRTKIPSCISLDVKYPMSLHDYNDDDDDGVYSKVLYTQQQEMCYELLSVRVVLQM